MTDTDTTKGTTATNKQAERFSDEERAAMQERARELKASKGRATKSGEVDGEAEVLAKIAELEGPERDLAERLHALIKASAPVLVAKTWYGQPAYAKDGKVICFFQPASKFKTRYATVGFSDDARIDDGTMWPTSFALTELTPADEARLSALVKRAVG